MIEITTSLLFLLGTLYGGQSDSVSKIEPNKNMERGGYEASIFVAQPLTLEEYVRLYYYDTPILAEIAQCESRFRHLGVGGKVIRGELSEEDVGIMQINEFYHEERAKRLGLNLHTLDGNLAYAKWLYHNEGTVPWFASAKCWQKTETLARADIKAKVN